MIHDARMLEYYIIWNARVRNDVMLPRVDGGHTWINYGNYSVLNFFLENWRKKASRVGLVLSFFLLPPQSVNRYTLVPWYVFSLYIIYPSRHLDAVLISLCSVRADPAYEAIHHAVVVGQDDGTDVEEQKAEVEEQEGKAEGQQPVVILQEQEERGKPAEAQAPPLPLRAPPPQQEHAQEQQLKAPPPPPTSPQYHQEHSPVTFRRTIPLYPS